MPYSVHYQYQKETTDSTKKGVNDLDTPEDYEAFLAESWVFQEIIQSDIFT
ncbi:hypothetical protein [Salmonirosea aquatica]|uniref:hypothetical protein n=1 Tax=Salmonirosea aquatica TaxID=2654236 RepID=UPI0035709FD4